MRRDWVIWLSGLLWLPCLGILAPAHAATITAASCAQADVTNAIGQASAGDVVSVPAGQCSWSGLSVAKPLHLRGAGVGQSRITLSGVNTIMKQTLGVVRMSGFSFTKTGGGDQSKGWIISGPWTNTEPVVIENNSFTVSGSGLFLLDTVGGVIIAGNSFTGNWDDSFIQPKSYSFDSNASWTTAATMGVDDAAGKLNHYIEDNAFYGGTNQGIDADDNTRVVYRYNRLTNSSFNSHGFDTSAAGVRHWEIYNNTWLYNPPVGSPPTDDLSNQGWAIWIRGGTGVIFNNSVADIRSSWWGDPPEYKFSIRGAEDARPQGSCANVGYPVPRQLGQGYDGSRTVTDRIYVWGNSGPVAGQSGGWTWGNPCNLTWTDFYQSGRDYVLGSAKPGYTPYTYPHPLRTGSPPPANQAPSVNAGADQTITLPSLATLSGTATDDGLPNPPATLTYSWSKVSGPGTVTFANGSARQTTATFSQAGTYVLRLTASDSALSGTDDVQVTVNPAPPVNQAPVANAGVDQAITLPSLATLSGTATDDGLPNPPAALTYSWSKVSGPGTVTFANGSARQTTATFSQSGTYMLRLTASDSALSATDDLQVTVNAAPDTTPPSAPSGLNLSQITGTAMRLDWTASTDNVAVTGYRLDVSANSGFTSFISGYSNRDLGNVTTFQVTGLSPNTAYYMRLRAYDAAGNVSGNSATATATTSSSVDTTPPSVPTNLRFSQIQDTSVRLDWNASTDNIAIGGYRLDVSADSGFASFVSGYANRDVGNVTGVTISGLTPGTQYFARLRAYDTSGNTSANSASASVTTSVTPGLPPLATPTLNLPSVMSLTDEITAGYSGDLSGVGFEWTFESAQGTLGAGMPALRSPGTQAFGAPVMVNSPKASLSLFSLSPGPYTVTVRAVRGSQRSSPASANVTLVSAELNAVRVYPNPWRADRHAGDIVFDNLPVNSTVKIFTVAGHKVWQRSGSGQVQWNRKTDSGDSAASGIYLYLIEAGGQKTRGKLAVVR